MNKRLLFSLFLLPLGLMAVGEKRSVPIKIDMKNPDKLQVQRCPIHLPIDVEYDSDTMSLEVSCQSPLEGEVYLYNASGEEEAYSPCLNTVLSVSDSQYHTIIIEGDGWEATGVIE